MMEKATFGGGCFWGVELAFSQMAGVAETAAGFMGGSVMEPSYRQVCTGTTGHVEVVQLCFDPDAVSYDSLLGAFWDLHDPTQVNRQGPDIGPQYRSAIFYHSDEQKAAAEASKRRRQHHLSGPITTELLPATTFFRAEEYHQKYLEKRGLQSCHL